MTSPPAKRQRTEDAPITRSDIWHSDGSVVLQTEDTQFRVHWGVLALHSSFFRDMQGLPQPPDQPSVDGCPVVELQDSTTDVTHLLKVLYDPSVYPKLSVLPIAVVAALLRLGRKYEFRKLLDLAVERLTTENPTTLEKYDRFTPDEGVYVPKRLVNYPGIIFDVLTLAREHNILSVLPCAYYRVSTHTSYLFSGLPRGDGTTASLALVEQHRCVLGRQKLSRAQSRSGYALGWLRSWVPDDGCTQPDECTTVRDDFLHDYLDLLGVWALERYSELHLTFCAACKPPNKEAVRAGRKKVWDDLPGFFDLPPWDELRNEL
ncbi:hypothetical protein FB451DRAFT_1017263 [Mycena latifolia]|nr:hypothetical protein FB451DRAFT_1017263 [Mycena latifolia]